LSDQIRPNIDESSLEDGLLSASNFDDVQVNDVTIFQEENGLNSKDFVEQMIGGDDIRIDHVDPEVLYYVQLAESSFFNQLSIFQKQQLLKEGIAKFRLCHSDIIEVREETRKKKEKELQSICDLFKLMEKELIKADIQRQGIIE